MHEMSIPPPLPPVLPALPLFAHRKRTFVFLASVLTRCPSLRRLWLFSNHITAMEGLHHCGALRELSLHDNGITTVAGVQSLVHLQVPARAPRQ